MRIGWMLVLAAAAAGCSDGDRSAPCEGEACGDGAAGEFAWKLPEGFPEPSVPENNPMSVAKVKLGRRLFYDVRLSENETFSCASCHVQELAFTDGKAAAVGSTGQSHTRSSMSLANVAYASTLTWANPNQTLLEEQAKVPMFGTEPVELGLPSEELVVERLRSVEVYAGLFDAAFPGEDDPVTLEHVTFALAAFERTLISGDSPFDRWQRDPSYPYGDSERRGFELFSEAEALECFHCHEGFNKTDHVTFAGRAFFTKPFHNTGLYNIDGKGGYPAPNRGLFETTGNPRDMGRFKAPTLRNVAVTGPYMHDGSVETLSDVLDHYAAGGRTIASGRNAGDGSKSPYKESALIRGFELSAQDRRDLLAFLETLTDETFLANPEFSDPWRE